VKPITNHNLAYILLADAASATCSQTCFCSPSFCGANRSSAFSFFVDVEPITILLFLSVDAEPIAIAVQIFYSSLREANQNCDLLSAEVEPIITLQVRAYDLGIPSLDAEVPVNIFTQVIIQ
jgi:hypothetical protein